LEIIKNEAVAVRFVSKLVHHRVNTGGERDGLCGGEELPSVNQVTR
jgi:hypothetical protein